MHKFKSGSILQSINDYYFTIIQIIEIECKEKIYPCKYKYQIIADTQGIPFIDVRYVYTDDIDRNYILYLNYNEIWNNLNN